MAVVTFGSISADAQTFSGACAVTKPTGVNPGDLLVIFYENFSNGNTPTLSGWTAIGPLLYNAATHTIGAFWRIADGTEGSTFTISGLVTTTYTELVCIRYTGCDPVKPIHASNIDVNVTTSTSLTSTIHGAMEVVFIGYDGGTTTNAAPSGWTRRLDGSASAYDFWGAERAQASAGATGTQSFAGFGTGGTALVHLLLAPASTPVTPVAAKRRALPPPRKLGRTTPAPFTGDRWTTLFQDDFTGTNGAAWNPVKWTLVGNSDFLVGATIQSNAGQMQTTLAGYRDGLAIANNLIVTDFDCFGTFQTNTTNQEHYNSINFRTPALYDSPGNNTSKNTYFAAFSVSSGSAPFIQIGVVVNDVLSNLGVITPFSSMTTGVWNYHLQAIGPNIAWTVWPADGSPEPAPQLTASDTTFTSGHIALSMEGGNVGGRTATTNWDNFRVVGPPFTQVENPVPVFARKDRRQAPPRRLGRTALVPTTGVLERAPAPTPKIPKARPWPRSKTRIATRVPLGLTVSGPGQSPSVISSRFRRMWRVRPAIATYTPTSISQVQVTKPPTVVQSRWRRALHRQEVYTVTDVPSPVVPPSIPDPVSTRARRWQRSKTRITQSTPPVGVAVQSNPPKPVARRQRRLWKGRPAYITRTPATIIAAPLVSPPPRPVVGRFRRVKGGRPASITDAPAPVVFRQPPGVTVTRFRRPIRSRPAVITDAPVSVVSRQPPEVAGSRYRRFKAGRPANITAVPTPAVSRSVPRPVLPRARRRWMWRWRTRVTSTPSAPLRSIDLSPTKTPPFGHRVTIIKVGAGMDSVTASSSSTARVTIETAGSGADQITFDPHG